jgi:hypothetical protein
VHDPGVSEPRAVAETIVEIVPGVWHWNVDDERIGGFVSASHAVATAEGTILIDPLPLAPDSLAQLGGVTAIVLTTSSHQRSSWRYRRELGTSVWLPQGTKLAEEEPDARYGEGDELPGGLEAVFAPGAGTTQHALLHDSVLFVSDHLVRPRGRGLALISEQYAHDAAQNRASLERLLEREFDVLCLGHGEPVTEDAKGALAALLS